MSTSDSSRAAAMPVDDFWVPDDGSGVKQTAYGEPLCELATSDCTLTSNASCAAKTPR